jgi:hypothetical protein
MVFSVSMRTFKALKFEFSLARRSTGSFSKDSRLYIWNIIYLKGNTMEERDNILTKAVIGKINIIRSCTD